MATIDIQTTGAGSTSSSDFGRRISRALRQMTQILDTHSRQLLKSQDVTIPQVMCLDELRDRGTMTVAGLANAIHLSASTTVGIIDRLEKKKLVKRMRDNIDRRSVHVNITEQGRNFINATPHVLHNRMNTLLQRLTDKQQASIAGSLDTLVLLWQEKPV